MSDIDAPSVSAVVATYGRPNLLGTFLTNLLDERTLDEVVVVLDGTEDASLDVAEELASREARLRPLWVSHRGQFGALDEGIRAARGDVVWLLDDDVTPTPGLADGHRGHHRGTSGLVVLGYMPVRTQPPPSVGDVASVLYAWEYESRCRRYEEEPASVLRHLWGGNLSMRRADYLALPPTALRAPVGLEDARLYHQDRELGLRCLAAGMRGRFDRHLLAVHEHRRDPAGFLRDSFGRGVCDVVVHRLHPDRTAAPAPRLPGDAAIGPRLLDPATRQRTLVGLGSALDAAVATGSWRATATTARLARRVAYGLGVAAADAARAVDGGAGEATAATPDAGAPAATAITPDVGAPAATAATPDAGAPAATAATPDAGAPAATPDAGAPAASAASAAAPDVGANPATPVAPDVGASAATSVTPDARATAVTPEAGVTDAGAHSSSGRSSP